MRMPYRPDALYYPSRRCLGRMKKTKAKAAAAAAKELRWWEYIFRMIYVFV